MKRFAGIFVVFCLMLSGCAGKNEETYIQSGVSSSPGNVSADESGHGYSVSSSCDIATEVGMSVLADGGNAVDAAVAMAFTLAVVEPYASGLGGGGALLIYDSSSGESYYYDYRSAAGGASSAGDSVSVPGFVLGLETVYNDYGTMEWADLLQYAYEYAAEGFAVNEALALRIETSESTLSKYPQFYNSDGDYLEEGDNMVQEDLAEIIADIQEEGSDVFYSGWIAEELSDNCALTEEDFSSYKVYKYDAVVGAYKGYTLYGAGAPMSATSIFQMLAMSEEAGLSVDDSSGYIEGLKSITNAVISNRYYTMSDPAFNDRDEQATLSEAYIAALLEDVAAVDPEEEAESSDTTSFSIVDSNGLIVSSTNTLSEIWGSHKSVSGILLNNTNENFSEEGVNAYEPYKRSRTFTSPVIAVKDDYVLSVGSSGGKNIPGRLFQILSNILSGEEEPQEAVNETSVLIRNGALYVETDDNGETWLSESSSGGSAIYRSTGSWWGSVSLAGYSEEEGAFAAYDSRRGATACGVYNP